VAGPRKLARMPTLAQSTAPQFLASAWPQTGDDAFVTHVEHVTNAVGNGVVDTSEANRRAASASGGTALSLWVVAKSPYVYVPS
jgi:hypothetical protein